MKLEEVVRQFLIDCEVRGLTEQAIGFYRIKLRLFVSKMDQECHVTELEDVKIVHLRQFVQLLMKTKADENNPRKPAQEKPLSAFTVRGYVRAIKRLFSWCIEEDILSSNPAARLVQPKAPEYLIQTFTTEHIEKMLSTCDITTPLGFRDYVMLLLFLDTGMRLSELCGLQVTDVYDRYVKVLGKGRKEREIGIHPEVGKLLWKYVNKYRHPTDPDEKTLFIGRRGEPLGKDGISTIISEVKKKSDLEGVRVSAHTFRHTFAKFYLQRGGEVFKLSREMGHGTIQVTELYLKDFRSTEARKEHTAYSPIGEINLKGKKKTQKKARDKQP